MKKYLWQNRVVILVHNDQESKPFKQQLRSFSSEKTAMEDRDMVVLTPKAQYKHKILDELRVAKDFQGVLLVGKDGGIKLKKDFPVLPETLFALVDTMPMRQAEMKRKKENHN